MDTKTKTIIGLIVLIGLLLLYFMALPKYNAVCVQKGYNAGINDLVSSISNTGNIPIISNGTIQSISITELCGRIR